MYNLTSKDKAILTGLFFSKFNRDGLINLGFENYNEAFNSIGLLLGINSSSIKNYRDEFDIIVPNSRKGWHKRGIRNYCKVFFDEYGSLEIEEFTTLINDFIYGENDSQKIIQVSLGSVQNEETFAKRLITGISAENYFINTFNKIPIFNELKIENTTKYGCGFDFKLFAENISYGIEVKGLRSKNGNILLTEKEYNVANLMKDNYFLFIVKNFQEKPFHEIYRNPLNNNLEFKRFEKPIIQINWSTKV